MFSGKEIMWKKIIAREYGVQYTEISLRSLSPESKWIVPATFYEQVYIPESNNQVCYVDEAKWNDFISSLKVKYLENPQNYEEFERLFMETGNDYMRTAEQIANFNLEDKSNTELKEMYIDYQRKSLRYAPLIWIQFIINNFFADKAKEIISNKLGADNEDLHDFIGIVLRPDKKAAAIQLSEFAYEWGNLNENEKMKIYEKFKWVPCLDIHNKPWTKEEFFSHISEFKKVEKLSPTSYEELMDKTKTSDEEREILDIAKMLAYLKDLKDDFRRQGVFYGQKLFKEIANRMKVELEDISYMLEEEIIEFLNNGKSTPKAVIEKRKGGFAIYFTEENKIECKSGDDVEPALKELGLSVSEEFLEEIKGIPASHGRAKGIVKIVKGVADLGKVQKGDILVAVVTHPDYVIAMHKAAAIITDEGGITSHAAILSREFGIPCVVGTKNATRSLKDGDEVDVDANSGIVKKIKK